VACLSGELTSLVALARSTTGDERKFSGEDDGFAADLLGVPLLLDGGPAASLCSWAAEASRGLLAAALRWDERRGVEDLELRWRRWPGEDMIRLLFRPNYVVEGECVIEGWCCCRRMKEGAVVVEDKEGRGFRVDASRE
jgi:hypothetical protein